MKKSILSIWLQKSVILIFSVFIAGTAAGQQVKRLSKTAEKLALINKLKGEIEMNPKNFDLHDQFISALFPDSAQIEKQYDDWIRKFPTVVDWAYAIGKEYSERSIPVATRYLLQAVGIDSTFVPAWKLLYYESAKKGEYDIGRNYLKKALAVDPDNQELQLSYAMSFRYTDTRTYLQLLKQLGEASPTSSAGGEALYYLFTTAKDSLERVSYLSLLYNSFTKQNSNLVMNVMERRYYEILEEDPSASYRFVAQILSDKKLPAWRWTDKARVSKGISEAQNLLNEGDIQGARTVLDTINLLADWRIEHVRAGEEIFLLKASVDYSAGNVKSAYDSLVKAYSKKPSERFYSLLLNYGSKLNLSADEIMKDVWGIRDSLSRVATDFSLCSYSDGKNVSLSEFKGKLVLLTYWFPTCGPCRAEFPYFESVLKDLGQQVSYLGINLVDNQERYVVPLVKSMNYSFIPLRDDPKRNKGTLSAVAAPTNYLIDPNGKIIFSGFYVNDEKSENTFRRMLAELLNREYGAGQL